MASSADVGTVETEQLSAAAALPAEEDAAASPARNSTGHALAVEVPMQTEPTFAAAAAGGTDGDADDAAPLSSRPASPLNIHSLLNRPFADVVREITSGFQLKSTAQVAAEQLRYLVVHRDHDKEVLAAPQLMNMLLQQVRESPGLPSAGSCMCVLAQLARTPEGRAQLRDTSVLQPVFRFLSMPDVLQKGNAEAALLLLENMSCDKLSRHTMLKAGAIDLMLGFLSADPAALKQQHPKLAALISGTLLNMVVGDGESSAAKHMFAKAGGLEIGCKVLAAWGRYDFSPATLRLRLLLADLGKLQQYSVQLHQTALDACTSARSAPPQPSSSDATGGPAGQLVSARAPSTMGAFKQRGGAAAGCVARPVGDGREGHPAGHPPHARI